jgi:hypothetical protein
MKILILTHGRSGGLSLSTWIEKELELELFHEPFIQLQESEYIKNNLFIKNNIVVKDYPFNIERFGYDVYEYIKTFDKLIIHNRNNLRDTAISHVSGLMRNIDITKKSNWHEVYEIDDEWIQNNLQKIEREESELLIRNRFLIEITKNKQIEGLRTTYAGIFETKEEIPILLNYLNIKKPVWIDMLDNRHKLKNGNVGKNDYILKPIIKRKII